MNTLSWMLWLCDAIPNLGGMFQLAVFLTAFGCGSLIMIIFVGIDEIEDSMLSKMKVARNKCFVVAICSLPFALITPTKSTMLAITASQLGEMIIDGKDVNEIKQEALITIKAWLQKNR